jgi:hypothetical protein
MEVNFNGDKGERIVLPYLVGMELGCADRNNQLVNGPLPHPDVDLYNKEEALLCTPLRSCPWSFW